MLALNFMVKGEATKFMRAEDKRFKWDRKVIHSIPGTR
jgi:hypothetical protein